MPVRRDACTMTNQDRDAFVAAVLELKRRGGYDALVQIHFDRMTADFTGQRVGHQSPSFLPWHRRYLLDFERRLQAINPKVTVPYWDWTVYQAQTAPLWSSAFLGGNGRAGDGQVVNGPFAYSTGKWPITVRVDSRPFLVRAMGVETPSLPSPASLAAAFARTPYDATPWSNQSTAGFRTALEGFVSPWLHNLVHDWVGGHMLQTVSPNDPVFFLHHAFIDKCWADWCTRNPTSAKYLPGGNTANVIDLNEPIPPWNDVTPASLLDHTRYYTYG